MFICLPVSLSVSVCAFDSRSAALTRRGCCRGRTRLLKKCLCWPTWTVERRDTYTLHRVSHVRCMQRQVAITSNVTRSTLQAETIWRYNTMNWSTTSILCTANICVTTKVPNCEMRGGRWWKFV